jgi:hypothetical protein
MNSEPLSEWIPARWNGKASWICCRASATTRSPLLRTVRTSVQPVARSATVSDQQKTPLLSPPSWPTRSTSTNPGRWSSHSAQVLIGILDFSSDAGLVIERPLSTSWVRSGASRRSMVAAEIATSWEAVTSVMSNSPWRRRLSTSSPITGASRFPVGPSCTAQMNRSASITSGPYVDTGVRGALGGRGPAAA